MISLKEKRVFVRVVTVVYMGAMLYASLLPDTGGKSTKTAELVHNLLHIPAYAILTYFLILCFNHANTRKNLYSASIAFFWGVLNEFVQSFVPSRTASISDMFLNAVGVLLVFFTMYLLKFDIVILGSKKVRHYERE